MRITHLLIFGIERAAYMVQFRGEKKLLLESVKEVISESELADLRAIGQLMTNGPGMPSQELMCYLAFSLTFLFFNDNLVLTSYGSLLLRTLAGTIPRILSDLVECSPSEEFTSHADASFTCPLKFQSLCFEEANLDYDTFYWLVHFQLN